MERKTQGPAIFDEVYQLILALYQCVRGFPKSQQFVLGQRMEHTAVAILAGVVEANMAADKLPPRFPAAQRYRPASPRPGPVYGQGNVMVTGYFNDSVDFGGVPLTSAGETGIFLMKLAP